MTLEIQVLAWYRDKKVADLKQLMETWIPNPPRICMRLWAQELH